MLARFWSWLTGPRDAEPHVDLVALNVTKRQQVVARRLSRLTGEPPEKLLDYRRADRLLRRRRR